MPFRCASWPSTRMRSSRRTPSSSAAVTGNERAARSKTLKTILDPGRPESRARAACRVALHVHRHRIHGDVRRRGLDVHGERGRVAAQALRPDAERVYRARQLLLELRALRVLAARA